MGACDVIDDIGVLAGDALLHWPRLSSQGARVCICVGRINATQTPGLSTLFENGIVYTTNCISCPYKL